MLFFNELSLIKHTLNVILYSNTLKVVRNEKKSRDLSSSVIKCSQNTFIFIFIVDCRGAVVMKFWGEEEVSLVEAFFCHSKGMKMYLIQISLYYLAKRHY